MTDIPALQNKYNEVFHQYAMKQLGLEGLITGSDPSNRRAGIPSNRTDLLQKYDAMYAAKTHVEMPKKPGSQEDKLNAMIAELSASAPPPARQESTLDKIATIAGGLPVIIGKAIRDR